MIQKNSVVSPGFDPEIHLALKDTSHQNEIFELGLKRKDARGAQPDYKIQTDTLAQCYTRFFVLQRCFSRSSKWFKPFGSSQTNWLAVLQRV